MGSYTNILFYILNKICFYSTHRKNVSTGVAAELGRLLTVFKMHRANRTLRLRWGMKIMKFLDMTPCNVIDMYRNFEEICYTLLHGME